MPTRFDVIEPKLKRCTSKGTDASYGQCVLKEMPVPAFPESTPLLSKYIGKGSGRLIERDVNGNQLVGGTGLRAGAKKCRASDKTKPLRPCHVELDVPNADDQQKYGLPNAPVLRLCSKKSEPGILVPLTSPEQALAIAREFCGCSGNSAPQGKRKKCARNKGAMRG